MGTNLLSCIFASLIWKRTVRTVGMARMHGVYWGACNLVSLIWIQVRTKSQLLRPLSAEHQREAVLKWKCRNDGSVLWFLRLPMPWLSVDVPCHLSERMNGCSLSSLCYVESFPQHLSADVLQICTCGYESTCNRRYVIMS